MNAYDDAVDYEFPPGKHVSEQLRDLLGRMLVADPNKRANLLEIEQHPWFRKDIPPDLVVGSFNANYLRLSDSVEHANTIRRQAKPLFLSCGSFMLRRSNEDINECKSRILRSRDCQCINALPLLLMAVNTSAKQPQDCQIWLDCSVVREALAAAQMSEEYWTERQGQDM